MTDVATVDREGAQGDSESNGSSPAASITQVAAETARNVKEEFAGVVDDVRHQASDQFEQQRNTATKAMTDFAAAIRKAGEELAQHDQSIAAKMIKQAADGLEGVSRSLSDKQPEELLDAARVFGRNNPVAFGAAAVLAGLAVGRFFRSSEGHCTPPGSSPMNDSGRATEPWIPPSDAMGADTAAETPLTSIAASPNTVTPAQALAADAPAAATPASTTAWRA